jgi:hypothetical protein
LVTGSALKENTIKKIKIKGSDFLTLRAATFRIA